MQCMDRSKEIDIARHVIGKKEEKEENRWEDYAKNTRLCICMRTQKNYKDQEVLQTVRVIHYERKLLTVQDTACVHCGN